MGLKWRAVAKRANARPVKGKREKKPRSIHRNVATKFQSRVYMRARGIHNVRHKSAKCMSYSWSCTRWGMRNGKVWYTHSERERERGGAVYFVGRSVFISSVIFFKHSNIGRATRRCKERKEERNQRKRENCSWTEQQGRNIAIWNEKDNTAQHSTERKKNESGNVQ